MNRTSTELRSISRLLWVAAACSTSFCGLSSGWCQEVAREKADGTRSVPATFVIAQKPAEPKPTEPKPVDPAEELRRERESRVISIMTDLIYQACLAHVMLEIDEHQRVAGIDESSVKRLQLAAKGAASQYAEKQVAQDSSIIVTKVPPLATMLSAGGEIYPLPVAEKEGEDPKNKPKLDELDPATVYPRIALVISEDSITWRYRERNGSSGWGRNGGLGRATENPIWTKAVDKNTTEAQRKKLKATRQQRLNKSATSLCVAMLEAKLHLDSQQRDQVNEIIKQVVDAESIVPKDFTNRGYGVVNKVLKANELKGLVEILSEAQGMVWKHQLIQIESGNF